jgi:large subunit ribosomal protein L10
MPNTKNIAAVKEIKEKVASAQAIFLADYKGLDLKSQRELRQKVKEAGGELIVTKNTLLKIALSDNQVDVDKIAQELEGQNITLFAVSDAISPLKAMVEFAKGQESNQPSLKTGILGKEILALEKVKQLANLPSKTELIAKLLGTLTNPARNLVGVLSAPTRNLVYAISAISKKKAVSN